jgi:hypothetical protein
MERADATGAEFRGLFQLHAREGKRRALLFKGDDFPQTNIAVGPY